MERRLGRGLGTLLGSKEEQKPSVPTGSAELAIESIRPNPYQPRRTFDDAALHELSESIRRHGVLQPVVVRQVAEGSYELIAGERRWRAATLARRATIPAVVRQTVTDAEMLELALVENVQRQDLDAIERAVGYRQMMDRLALTQEQVADRVGLRRSTVANHLRLLDLPEAVQAAVAKGLVSMGHARALLALPTPAEQRRWMEKVVRDDLSVRQVEQLVRMEPKRAHAEPPNRSSVAESSWVQALEERLRRRLGTKVTVVNAPGYRGELRIEYFGKESLQQLIDVLDPPQSL